MTSTLTRDPMASSQAVPAASAPIPFSRLLRVEWGKATDTRSARWLLATVAAATILIMLAPMLAKHSIDQTWRNYLGFPALVISNILPVVAILTLTTEWTQRTVLTTFTQEPRRGRVIRAKVAVCSIIALLATAFGGLVTLLAGWLISGGRHLGEDVHPAQLVGFLVFILLYMLMGVAFGALLHNTAASIVLFFLLPTVFAILGGAVHSLGNWIDPSKVFGWAGNGNWHGHGAQLVVATVIWVLVPLALGIARTMRREIK